MYILQASYIGFNEAKFCMNSNVCAVNVYLNWQIMNKIPPSNKAAEFVFLASERNY